MDFTFVDDWGFWGFVIAVIALFFTVKDQWQKGLTVQVLAPSGQEKIKADLDAEQAKQGAGWHKHLKRSVLETEAVFDGWFGERLFSWRAFGRCLTLAFLYPILFFMIAWAMGGDGDFGELPILSNAPPFGRPLTLLILSLWFIGFLFYFYKKIPHQIAHYVRKTLERSVPRWLKIHNGIYAILEISSGALATIFAIAIHSSVAITVSGASTSALEVAIAGAGVGAITFASASAIVGVGISAVTLSVAFTSIFAATFTVILIFTGLSEPLILLLLFYILLPLINALLDWHSWSVTRWFLRLSTPQDGKALKLLPYAGWLLADVITACVFLILLAIFYPMLLRYLTSCLRQMALRLWIGDRFY